MKDYKLIVVGAGPGGYVAAEQAARLLDGPVAVVERSQLGGICLNWGCIPTKALLKSAQALHYAQSASEYGFSASEVKPDIEAIVARSRAVSGQLSKGVEHLLTKAGVEIIYGEGFLEGEGVVKVTSAADGSVERIHAEHIIVATGSRPNALPFAPIDGEKIICYYQALMPRRIPASIAIIGSGAIGSEFAFFYRSMGSEVTLIEYVDRVLPVEDDDTSAAVSRAMRKMGIKVMTSAGVQSVDTSGEACVLSVQTKKGLETVEAEIVLSAAGVKPNTDMIGLEEIGVELVRGKVKVDEWYRSSVPGIYAIGDIVPGPALAHLSSAEAICCVRHIAGADVAPVDYGNIPGCTYISPEVASVGMTERAAKEAGIDYRVGKVYFLSSGKAVAAGQKDGFVKLIADASTRRILGAHLVGDNVTEIIAGIVAARAAGATVDTLAWAVSPHPTMSESVSEAARQIIDNL